MYRYVLPAQVLKRNIIGSIKWECLLAMKAIFLEMTLFLNNDNFENAAQKAVQLFKIEFSTYILSAPVFISSVLGSIEWEHLFSI